MTPSNKCGCLMSVKFDWSVADVASKWHRPQQAFMYSTLHLNQVGGIQNEDDYPFNVIDTRLKVRGTGRVMVVRYESEPGKDFELLGHSTPFTVEQES